MLGLSELKQTKFYQEALEEGLEQGKQQGLEEGLEQGKQQSKLETIPRMVDFGLSLDAIAQLLDLPLEVVQQVVQQTDG